MNEEFLKLKEAAAFLKRSPASVYQLKSAGKLPAYQPTGRALLFKRSELQDWVERGAVNQPARRSK